MTGAAVVTRAMSAMTMSTGTTGSARVRSRRAVRGRGRVAATRADGEAEDGGRGRRGGARGETVETETFAVDVRG